MLGLTLNHVSKRGPWEPTSGQFESIQTFSAGIFSQENLFQNVDKIVINLFEAPLSWCLYNPEPAYG